MKIGRAADGPADENRERLTAKETDRQKNRERLTVKETDRQKKTGTADSERDGPADENRERLTVNDPNG